VILKHGPVPLGRSAGLVKVMSQAKSFGFLSVKVMSQMESFGYLLGPRRQKLDWIGVHGFRLGR
jgi:hypothetical protein